MIRKKIELFIFGFYDHPNVMQTGVINSSRIWWPTFWRNICFFLVSSSCGSDCNFSSFTLFCMHLFVCHPIYLNTNPTWLVFVCNFILVMGAFCGKWERDKASLGLLHPPETQTASSASSQSQVDGWTSKHQAPSHRPVSPHDTLL